MGKFFKWFTSLGNIAKAAGAIIALVATVIGGIRGYNAYIIRQHDKDVLMRQNQHAIIIRLDSIQRGQQVIRSEVMEMKETVNSHDKSLKALKDSYVNLLKESGKIDELIRYYESTQDMLKKNGLPMSETQYGLDEYLIPYSLIYKYGNSDNMGIGGH